jgi:DNA-binding FadR family transcriptional regulator
VAGGVPSRGDLAQRRALLGAQLLSVGAAGPERAARRLVHRVRDVPGGHDPLVARTAAERRTPQDVRALRNALAAFGAARTPQQEHAADTAIHRAVTRATGNPQVASLTQGLLATVTVGLPIEPYSRDVFDQALAEHTALVDAVVAGEAERAGAIARDHFAMTARTLRGVLRRGAPSGPEQGRRPDPAPAGG